LFSLLPVRFLLSLLLLEPFVSVSVFVSIGLFSVLLFTEKVKTFSHFVLSAPKFGFRSSFSIPAAHLGSVTYLFMRWFLLVRPCFALAFDCRGSCFSTVSFSGARDFVLCVSFHRIWKSRPACLGPLEGIFISRARAPARPYWFRRHRPLFFSARSLCPAWSFLRP
jgi:hypothetical protein